MDVKFNAQTTVAGYIMLQGVEEIIGSMFEATEEGQNLAGATLASLLLARASAQVGISHEPGATYGERVESYDPAEVRNQKKSEVRSLAIEYIDAALTNMNPGSFAEEEPSELAEETAMCRRMLAKLEDDGGRTGD